jgi:hypothetical protein
MKPSILSFCSITIAALLLVSCEKQHSSTPAASAEGAVQTKLRAGGLELTATGTRTSYAPQDDDLYAEFLLKNISGSMMPFQAAVGTGFDQSHRAVFISTAEFTAEGGVGRLSINHYPLDKTAAPQEFGGPAIELPPDKTIRLALRVGRPGLVTDAQWKVLRPDAQDVVFVIHGIPDLFK